MYKKRESVNYVTSLILDVYFLSINTYFKIFCKLGFITFGNSIAGNSLTSGSSGNLKKEENYLKQYLSLKIKQFFLYSIYNN